MFSIISFQENGERIEHVGQKPAFYAVLVNGTIVDYFSTLDAVHYALERMQFATVELERTEKTIEFKLAA